MNAADTNTFKTEITMTDQSNPTPDPDDRKLHDEAAELAEGVAESLRCLSEEGIPQRIQRLRRELVRVLEAMWFIGDVAEAALTSRSVPGLEGALGTGEREQQTVKQALGLHHFSAACQAYLMNSIEALDPLAVNDAGRILDEALEDFLATASEEYVRDYFIGLYSDSDRDKKVAQLNALLRRDADGGEEEVQP